MASWADRYVSRMTIGRNDVLALLSRWRIDLASVVVVPVIALARPSHAAILEYLPMLVAGVALRTWARGHLDRRRLTSSGPYAYVRHPLYVGSFLMGLAITLMTRHSALPFLYAIVFAVMYWPKAIREETFQRARSAAEWDRYAAVVGSVLPRLRPPFVPDEPRCFTWRRVMRHREWKTWLGTVAALVVLWLRARSVG